MAYHPVRRVILPKIERRKSLPFSNLIWWFVGWLRIEGSLDHRSRRAHQLESGKLVYGVSLTSPPQEDVELAKDMETCLGMVGGLNSVEEKGDGVGEPKD